jgi:hypothetical protein
VNNILQVLLSPLTKLNQANEENAKTLSSMEMILRKWDTSADIGNELKQQTILLGDIKQLLIDQNQHFGVKGKGAKGDSKDGKVLGDASKFKGMDAQKSAAMAALVIGAVTAIVFGAYLLSTMAPISIGQMLTALVLAGVLMLVTDAFVKLGDAFFGSKLESNVDGETGSVSASMVTKGGMLGVVGSLAAILGMLTLVVLGSWLLTLTGQPSGMQLLTALAITILFIPLAFAFKLISEQLAKGMGTKSAGVDGMSFSATDTSGIWSLMGASLIALIGMVTAVVVGSWLISLVAPASGMQLLTAVVISLAMVLLSKSISQTVEVLAKHKLANLQGLATVGIAVLAMVAGIGGIVLASWILMGIAPVTMDMFISALAVGIILIPISWAMGSLLQALSKAGISPDMNGIKMVGLAGLAMAVMGAAIVGVAWILLLLPDPNEMAKKTPPFMWSLIVGLTMVAFAWSFSSILNAIKGASPKDLLLATAAMVIIGLAILGIAYLFMYLPDGFKAPDAMWSLKVGLALLMFALPFVLVAFLVKKMSMGYEDLLKGLLAMAAIAIAIFAVSWLFSALPSEFMAPDPEWSMKAAVAIFLFSIPMVALGIVMETGVGIGAILLGAVAMVVVAIAILAVAWIFNFLPDLGKIGDNITSFILAPVNGIVDVLVRLKEEVGVKNLVPLAVGIAAISVSLLLLAGAVAGVAAGGVLAALGNAAKGLIDGIASFFGAEKSKGPLEILDDLIKKRNKIAQLAPPLTKVSRSLEGFVKAERAVVALNGILTTLLRMVTFGGIGDVADGLKQISDAMGVLRENTKGFSTKPIYVLMKLFKLTPYIEATAESMGKLAEHFTVFAIQSMIAGIGLEKIANAYVVMSSVTEDDIAPTIKFFDTLLKDTYTAQADALVKMAPAVISMVNAGGENSGLLSKLMNRAGDHPVVSILKALNDGAPGIVAVANPLSRISRAFNVIGSQPFKSMVLAKRFVEALDDASFDKQARALERIASAYERISESSNRMNVEAIKANTDMVKALGYLSNKGGQGAIEKLGENLIKAIEEFGQMIEKYAKISASPSPGPSGPGPRGFFGPSPAPVNMAQTETTLANIYTLLQNTGIKIKTATSDPTNPTGR